MAEVSKYQEREWNCLILQWNLLSYEIIQTNQINWISIGNYGADCRGYLVRAETDSIAGLGAEVASEWL